jgi:hypothetical protein
MFRGSDTAWTIFMIYRVIRHKLGNSKGKHNWTHTFAISVRRSNCWSTKSRKPKAASLFKYF